MSNKLVIGLLVIIFALGVILITRNSMTGYQVLDANSPTTANSVELPSKGLLNAGEKVQKGPNPTPLDAIARALARREIKFAIIGVIGILSVFLILQHLSKKK